MLASLSPQRRRLVVSLLAVCAIAGALGVAAAVRDRPDAPAVAQDQVGPVLLVPGYGGSRAGLDVLAQQLRGVGRTVEVVQLPGDGTGDLREAADVLDQAADDALAAGAPSVDVVGYSAGGVTARYWAAELGGAVVARRVVTLGSPHHGAELAQLGSAFGRCPEGCRQLAPGSDLLRALNDDDETPDGPAWTSVWTVQDDVVTPPDTARLTGATNVVMQDVCPGVTLTHGELPRSPLVVGVVVAALRAGAPATSFDCVSS